jgi:hypothetical protein
MLYNSHKHHFVRGVVGARNFWREGKDKCKEKKRGREQSSQM